MLPVSELLRRDQVARIFNVSVRTVSYWAAKGRLPSIKTPGGQYRFRPEDVSALVQNADGLVRCGNSERAQ